MAIGGALLGMAGGMGGAAGLLGTLYVKLTADSTQMVKGLTAAQGSVVRSAAVMGKAIAGMSLAVGAAFAGLAAIGVKTAADFESSFAGVRKTVDATEAEFSRLKAAFRGMSKEIPVNVNELNHIAEAAGQLGIKTANLVGFTRVMADLGNTTNLSSSDAATQLARLANITQMSQKDFDRLGSTIVALGNNFATTEAEIVGMALRIAGAGKVVGLTEAQILSMAAGLSSVGIEAEAGGTAMSQAMIKMAKAVAQGSEELDTFAATAGMTAEGFSKAFKEDATGAILKFFEGLKKMTDEGGDVFTLLEKMELDGIRLTDVMLRVSGAGDLFARSLKLGTEAWKENNALTEEARKRYETFYSQLKLIWNTIQDVFLSIGNEFLPVFKAFIAAFGSADEASKGLSETLVSFIRMVMPLVIKSIGIMGDDFNTIRGGLKLFQAAFYSFGSNVISVFSNIVKLVGPPMESLIQDLVTGFELASKGIQLLIPPQFIAMMERALKLAKEVAASLPQVSAPSLPQFKFGAIDTASLDAQSKEWKERGVQAVKDAEAIWSAEKFSERFSKEYEKLTATVAEENDIILADSTSTWGAVAAMAQATIAEATKQMPTPGKQDRGFDDMLKASGIESPGTSSTLSSMEDPLMAQTKAAQEEIRIAQWRYDELEMMAQMEMDATGQVNEKKLQMMDEYGKRVKDLQMAQNMIALQASSQMFGDLATMAEGFAGKQSGIYKAMFAASKAFAIAEATIKIFQGIANAASNPYPYNLVAMASVIAATATIVSSIQSTKLAFAGERAMGGPVSSGKSYLVGEKGPELFSPSSNGNITPNDEMGGGVKVIINNFTDAKAEVSERNEGSEKVIEVMIRRIKGEIGSEIRDGRGDVNKAMETTFNLKRGR